MSANNENTIHQCRASKKDDQRCSARAVAGSQVCTFHKDAKPTFPPKELAHCTATTLKGAPCKNPAKENGLCGTHARDTTKGRKPSSRKGMVTANNLFTKAYWAGKEKGTGSAKECATLWKQAKAAETKTYQQCVAAAKEHNETAATA